MNTVTVIIGSKNDLPKIEPLFNVLDEYKIGYTTEIISAHRNLDDLLAFLKTDKSKVIIAAAGLSAALPGVVAAQTTVPVIGIPLDVGAFQGIDALLSILQLPKGIPCATMGVGKQGVINAGHFAKRILDLVQN